MFNKVLEITLPIFFIVLVGFFYSRHTKPNLASSNKLILDLALPALIFTSLSSKNFDIEASGYFLLVATLIIFLSGLVVFPISRFSGINWRGLLPCVMFGNVGPIGIPLALLAYGQNGLPPAVILFVLSNVLHFTVGAWLMSGRWDAKTIYASPLVWSTLLGILFSKLHWHIPKSLDISLSMISQILVPMMLISLGARLGQSQFQHIQLGSFGSMIAIAIRLPLALLFIQFVPLSELQRGILILFSALPPAVFNFMLADRFNQESTKVAAIVFTGHIASLAFLPLAIWLVFS